MQKVLLTFLIAASGFLTAQRSSLDISGSLNHSYRTLTSSDGDSQTKNLIASRNDREAPMLGAYFGLHYNRQIANTTHLRTGLRLTAQGYRHEIMELVWGTQHDGSGGFDPNLDPNAPNSISGDETHFFVELPMLIRRKFSQGGWAPYFEAGLAPGIYVLSRTRTTLNTETDSNYSSRNEFGLNRFHLGASLAVGIARNLGVRYQIFAQPIFRYQLTPSYDAPIKERFWNAGLEIGLRRAMRDFR